MKKRIATVCAVVLGVLVFAVPAMAQSTINVRATFHEFLGSPTHAPNCPPGWSCGSGGVTGLGAVSENVDFVTGVRTITFSDGSTLVTDESGGVFNYPGQSNNRQPIDAFGHPFNNSLTEVVDGSASTGIFAGASGTLTGQASVAGSTAVVTLSGQITLG